MVKRLKNEIAERLIFEKKKKIGKIEKHCRHRLQTFIRLHCFSNEPLTTPHKKVHNLVLDAWSKG